MLPPGLGFLGQGLPPCWRVTSAGPPACASRWAVRRLIHERFELSLGTALGKIKGCMFRSGHLGDCDDLTLLGAPAGVEMGLKLSGVALAGSGVAAAIVNRHETDGFCASNIQRIRSPLPRPFWRETDKKYWKREPRKRAFMRASGQIER